MLQGTKLACLLPICQILYSSRLDNLLYDMVRVPGIIPHQIKVVHNALQETERARVRTHRNRTAQTNKVHSLLIQISPQHHTHNKHKVSIDRSAAKVSMFKASVQTEIDSRFTSKH